MAKDIYELGRDLEKWAKENGYLDVDGKYTEKGRLMFRQSFLDKTQADNYFAGLELFSNTFAAQMQSAVKELDQLASEESEVQQVVSMFRDCARTNSNLYGIMISITRVVDAVAMNHADMLKDFKELVTAFNRSEQEGKEQLQKLQLKLEQQEKEIEKAKPYIKWFQNELPVTENDNNE